MPNIIIFQVVIGVEEIRTYTIENKTNDLLELRTVSFPTDIGFLLHGYTSVGSANRVYRIPPHSMIDINFSLVAGLSKFLDHWKFRVTFLKLLTF